MAGLRMTGNRLKRKDAGFTLIEILVAVVILSTGIVLVLQTFNTSLMALGASRDVLYSHTLAAEKIAELENKAALDGALEQGKWSGRFEGDCADYLWHVEVRRLAVKDDIPFEQGRITATLNEIVVSVGKKDSDRTCSLVTYVTCTAEEIP